MGPDLRHLLAAVARRTGPAGVRGARAGARRCAETVGNDHDTVAAPPRGDRAGGRLGGVRTSAALVIGGLFRRELTRYRAAVRCRARPVERMCLAVGQV